MNDQEPRCPRCGEPFGALRSQTVCAVCGTTLDWRALAVGPSPPKRPHARNDARRS
jgi:hypothetical protein